MKSVKVTACNCEQIKEKDAPAYMSKGFKYLDGTIKSNDYRIADEHGNVFTWVGERVLENGEYVNGFFSKEGWRTMFDKRILRITPQRHCFNGQVSFITPYIEKVEQGVRIKTFRTVSRAPPNLL